MLRFKGAQDTLSLGREAKHGIETGASSKVSTGHLAHTLHPHQTSTSLPRETRHRKSTLESRLHPCLQVGDFIRVHVIDWSRLIKNEILMHLLVMATLSLQARPVQMVPSPLPNAADDAHSDAKQYRTH